MLYRQQIPCSSNSTFNENREAENGITVDPKNGIDQAQESDPDLYSIYKVRASEENITRNSGRIIFVTISFEWFLIKAQSLELV